MATTAVTAKNLDDWGRLIAAAQACGEPAVKAFLDARIGLSEIDSREHAWAQNAYVAWLAGGYAELDRRGIKTPPII